MYAGDNRVRSIAGCERAVRDASRIGISIPEPQYCSAIEMAIDAGAGLPNKLRFSLTACRRVIDRKSKGRPLRCVDAVEIDHGDPDAAA